MLVAALIQLVVLGSGQYIPQSLLRNPPNEATAIKSWAFLKDSMAKVGDQVMQLLLIRKDVTAMTDDLRTQVQMWHQAELELGAENAKLAAEEKALQRDVQVGESVRLEVTQVEQQLADEKHRTDVEIQRNKHQDTQWAAEKKALEARRAELEKQIKEGEDKMRDTDARQQQEHLELLTDGQALKLKIAELQEKVKDKQTEVSTEKGTLEQKTADTKKHLADLKAGLKGMIGSLVPKETILAELEKLKNELGARTNELLTVQQAHSVESQECQKKTAEIQQVLAQETSKAEQRHQETARFCQPIQGQHDVLKQEVAACMSKA